jgi:hypothetical protein
MMDDKSVAEELFDEDDAIWSDADASARKEALTTQAKGQRAAIASEPHNPQMTLAQLLAPTLDPEIDKLTHTLVICEAVTPAGVFEFHKLVEKLDDLVFESGPALTTRMVRSKLLTAEQAKAYRGILAE